MCEPDSHLIGFFQYITMLSGRLTRLLLNYFYFFKLHAYGGIGENGVPRSNKVSAASLTSHSGFIIFFTIQDSFILLL